MKNNLGVYFVVPGSLGVPQPAWAQSWSVAQSKSRKGSFQCRMDSWSADVTITQYSWKVHKAQHASSRKSLAVGKVFAEFTRRGKLFAIITIIVIIIAIFAGTASRKKRSSRDYSSRDSIRPSPLWHRVGVLPRENPEKVLSNAGLTVGVQMCLSHTILGWSTKHSRPLRGKASRQERSSRNSP